MGTNNEYLDISDINLPEGIPKIDFFKSHGEFEAECTLHTLCNLRCKFCFETTEGGERGVRKVNPEYIKGLSDKIVNAAAPQIEKHNLETLKTTLWGGELLADFLPDSLFEVYANFIFEVRDKLKERLPNVKHRVVLLSNGVFKNRKRVREFLDKTGAQLAFSYDPVDRFATQGQRDIWWANYEHFADKLFALSITLTKRNIDAYISGDKMYERIGNVLHAEINHYSPRLDYHRDLPSDDDLFRYYKWCLNNSKFNISGVDYILKRQAKHLVPNVAKSCNCKLSYSFSEEFEKNFGKEYVTNCVEMTPFPKECFYGKHADQVDDVNCSDAKSSLGMIKRGCLSCEYCDNCQMMCWTLFLFNKYEVSECPFKRAYKYIDENPRILANYKEWRERNDKD